MLAHILSALTVLMCATPLHQTHAQTTSETLWENFLPKSDASAVTDPLATSKSNKTQTLPYCKDLNPKIVANTKKTPKQPEQAQTDLIKAVGNQLSNTSDQELILRGSACIERNGIQVQGDRIEYDQKSEQINVSGHAQMLKSDGARISGESLQYNLSSQTGQVRPAEFDIHATDGHGTAESLSLLSQRRALLNQARYTTCQTDKPDWYIKADTLLLDQDQDVGIGRNATLVFKDIPIFGAPYVRLPLGNRRQSGFLTPTITYSTVNGTSLSIPYYINLAPNYDLTLNTEYLTERGAKFSGDYRYLTNWGEGSLYGDWLPEDKKKQLDTSYRSKHRYYWHITHSSQGDLGSGKWWANINAQKTSDNQFIDDFGARDWDAGNRNMPSELSLNYKDKNWAIQLRKKTYQTLQTSSNQIDVPYDFEPQLNVRYRTQWHNWKLNTQLESTQFTHTDLANKAQGWRHILHPSISYEWRKPGAFIIPKAGLHLTQYNLNRAPNLSNSTAYSLNARRSLPIFSIDSGLILERNDIWFNKNITQTIEPRLYYAYIPYKNQSNIWNFDSALADLDFSRIYTENLFTGNDRIAQANQITTGATSRVLEQNTGEELFQFSLAQRYYFTQQAVSLSGITETNNVFRKSDILAGASGKVARQLWAQVLTQYNSENGTLLRTDAAIRWQPGYRRVFNLGYHKNRILTEPAKSAYAAAQFPVPYLTNNAYAVARINYNLQSNRVTDAWAGFEYAKNCWIIRLVGQHSLTSSNTIENSVSLQWVLKGLGNVGNRTDHQLSNQIEGYHPTTFD